MKTKTSFIAAIVALTSGVANAASFSAGDLITATSQFNGFEGIISDNLPFPSSYVEDGISVNQVNETSIYTGSPFGLSGDHAWYANGGDHGYTRITEQDGSDFNAVSVLTANGWDNGPGVYLHYELRNNGVSVLSGSYQQLVGSVSPVTFSDGGFDEILLSATLGTSDFIGSGALQGLAIDDIRVGAVPEPETYTMLLAGLGLLGFMARHKKRISSK